MLSVSRRFLFVHRGKSGGNSVSDLLKPWSEDSIDTIHAWQDGKERFEVFNSEFGTRKHFRLAQYKEVLPPALYDSLFKFSIIRNPWDRMISVYFSPNRLAKHGLHDFEEGEFLKLVQKQKTFRDFVCLERDDALLQHMGFVIRFEHFAEDIPVLCEKLGIPPQPLKHLNKGERGHYRDYYNERTRQAVAERFAEEIAFFGYSY